MSGLYEYIRDPAAIYDASFAAIEAECDFSPFDAATKTVAMRLVHACARPEILPDILYSPDATDIGVRAMQDGANILCDVEMVSRGIIRSRLSNNNQVICTLGLDNVAGIAKRLETTRSAAAVELWEPFLEGSIVAIGNAPTTLFHLMEKIDQGYPRPALILGFPVGFIGAAESKQALHDAYISRRLDVPYMTLRGRFGGSALASAAVNALSGL